MLSSHMKPVARSSRLYNGNSRKLTFSCASSSKGSAANNLPVPASAATTVERLSRLQASSSSRPAAEGPPSSTPTTRRAALVALPAAALSAALLGTLLSAPRPAVANTSLLEALAAYESQPSTSGREEVDTTITHRVAITIGIADRALKRAEERTIGDKSIIPPAAPVGRVVIGLYGNVVPRTVSNFLALVESGNLVGSTFSRVLAGEYIQAGKQGSKRLGAVEVPDTVQSNPEVSEASAFRLSHYRPGTVSLALRENDEEPNLRQRSEYRPLEFLITTGPGPVPRLDGQNIVFGRVMEGMSVVGQVAQVPVFGPSPVGNSAAFNSLASAIGDDRAAIVRRKYGKPLKAVVILASEVLPVEEDEEEGGTAAGAAP